MLSVVSSIQGIRQGTHSKHEMFVCNNVNEGGKKFSYIAIYVSSITVGLQLTLYLMLSQLNYHNIVYIIIL